MLFTVKGYEIPFVSLPFHEKILNLTKMSKGKFSLVEQEFLEMLEKGATQKVVPTQGRFLSNLFLVEKEDGGNRSVINLKNLSKLIPYEHFKMEGLYCLKFLLEQNDLLCKIDLKETYFQFPSTKTLKSLSDFNGQATCTNFFAYILDLGQLQEFLQNY